ncbi:TraE/TraK family type IV conjugative transfer system protein [soil metagenome]
MKSLIHQSRLRKLLRQRNGYLVLAMSLVFLSVLLVGLCFYLAGRERTVITPAVVERSFWVSNSEVSSEYLSEMSSFFAYLGLNLTPENADSQRHIFLRYTDPKYYGVLNNHLIAQRDRIKEQHIATAFYPINVKVNTKGLTALITGDLISSVGTVQLSPQRVVYEITYRYNDGRLWVSKFEEVKPHA